MPRKYSKQQTEEGFFEYLRDGFNPEKFYREKRFFNKRGVTSEGIPYTEVYAELILNQIIPSALVFENSLAAKAYSELNKRPFLKDLLARMGVRTFIISEEIIPAAYRINTI